MTTPARRPDEAALRDYQLGRPLPAHVVKAIDQWLEEEPGAADELSRIEARDRVTDALCDTAAGNTSLPVARPVPLAADVPAKLDWFDTVRELGRGGMGIVLESHDTRLNRRVAVKIISPQFATDGAIRDRFMREARAVAMIDHPNVVPVLQVGESAGVPYLVMPLLKGVPLDVRLKTGRPSVPEMKKIGRGIAAGLAAAHAVGLVHRDIKPGNVWLDEGTDRVRVLDFGLAKPLDRAETDAPLTRAGAIVGTPHYMAPEQAAGRPTDFRADLFSLGAVLYQMATGERPFTGETVFAVIAAVATHTPPEPKTLNPELPPNLSLLIDALLHKNPDARPESAAVVERALSQPDLPPGPVNPWDGIDAPEDAFDGTEVYGYEDDRPSPPKPRSRAWIAVALLFAAVALAAVVVVVVRDKNGKEVARLPVPEGGSVGIEPQKGNSPAPKVETNTADRRAAEAIIAGGGRVTLEGQAAAHVGPLPREPFRIAHVFWRRTATDAGVASLKGCTRVTELDLTDSPGVTDAGVAACAGWTQLTNLGLQGARVTDAGYANFKGCTELRSLNVRGIGGVRATDTGLAHFKSCKKLTSLDLGFTSVTAVGFAHFKGCTELELLYLDGCERLTPVALAQLAEYPRLRTLGLQRVPLTGAGLDQLKGCKGLTQLLLANTNTQDPELAREKVEELARALPECRIEWNGGTIEPTAPDRAAAHRAIELGGSVSVNGDGREIATTADLPVEPFRLTGVRIVLKKGVTDATLMQFRNCKDVEHLNLTGTGVGDAVLKHFENCRRLRILELAECDKVTDATTERVKNFPRLAMLVLQNTAITDAGIEHLKGCRNLMWLWVNVPSPETVTAPKVFELAKALPRCRISSFHGWSNDKSDLPADRAAAEYVHSVGGGVGLQSAVQQGVNGDGRLLAPADGLPKEPFWLLAVKLSENPRVTDTGLAVLKDCRNLVALNLDKTAVTDAGVAALAGHENLTALYLDGTKVTDAGVAHFRGCKWLTSLSLANTAITDKGLAEFKDCTGLRVVYLNNTKVTDAGLATLKGFAHLAHLQLDGTAVTDAGLAHLRAHAKLKKLILERTKVTNEGAAELAKALPACHIVWDGGEIKPPTK